MLGSGPTSEDIQRQDPLTGRVGKELLATFDEAGIRRDEIQVVHAYACAPTKLRKDKDERKAVLACRPLLLDALKHLHPATPTMLAGKWATLAVIGKEKGLQNTRGFADRTWTLNDIRGQINETEPETDETAEDAEEADSEA